MQRPNPTAISLSLALIACAVPAVAADAAWEPFVLESFDGEQMQGSLGRLQVPRSRDGLREADLELAFVRLPSTAEHPGPPIVYLAGGPGGSGIGIGRVPGMFDTFRALTAVADVILLDQRGTGRSRPLPFCPAEGLPDPAIFGNWAVLEREALNAIRACRQSLLTQGVDPGVFNTLESAHDLDAVRRALGADSISLLGFSYGTHLALAAIREHGAFVHRAVLVGTEGPDHTRKLPSSLDQQMERLSPLVAADPSIGALVPDMAALAREVLERLDREPMTVTIDVPDVGPIDVPVGRGFLEYILLRDLGDGNDLPVFPALLYTIGQGDGSLLAWFVRKRAGEMTRGVFATPFAVDGASGASPEREARIRREAETSLFGRAATAFFPEAGEAIGARNLGPRFRSRLTSEVPVLFLSGRFDSNTPPYQAEEMLWGFPYGTHLVVENAGHEDMLGTRAVGEVLVDWFRGEDVSDRRLAVPPLDFLSVEEARENRGL